MTANVAILSEHVHCYMHLEDNCTVHVCIICVWYIHGSIRQWYIYVSLAYAAECLKYLFFLLFSGVNYRQNWPGSCKWIAMMYMQDFGVNMVKGTTKINAANIYKHINWITWSLSCVPSWQCISSNFSLSALCRQTVAVNVLRRYILLHVLRTMHGQGRKMKDFQSQVKYRRPIQPFISSTFNDFQVSQRPISRALDGSK